MMIDNSIMNAFLSMGVIVAVLIAVLIFLKRIAKKKQSGNNNIGMKVISRQPLQHKAQLVIVEVKERTLLLGLTEQNVSLISDLTEGIDQIAESEKLENVFPTSTQEMKRSLQKAVKSDNSAQQDLSFKAFIKNAFSKE